ncbi:type I polyketide synthase [Ktedonobacter robiniae]|uniref:Polyketide synthase n=1 Tax=Ktedonobacter robiniae TaxID=2778365 RepID=A0ABQ3V333_9CHLR|nr:type I polyketide synthase [Ktedonobacter robiniae]GHO59328.1 polyketide synthase [Ktedonobacter robiniae]
MSTTLSNVPGNAIAIVGMGCRFPGAPNPDAFWKLMAEGGDAITEVPRDRYDVDAVYDSRPATPGKVMSRFGGFLAQVDQFDAAFFGLSPREVSRMDPQHRLLLEVAWEAMEDAGLVPGKLRDEVAGVFIGVITSDYWDRQFRNPTDLDVYSTAGNSRSGAAGRISYALGLQGVSVALDAACSSSLVAVHLACQSLRTGACTMALAGGVNIILNPDHTIGFSQGRMMAPDGHCKAFDARADGYVRSEGAGVVALKTLEKALADGDQIHAVIRGSSSNNDGHCDLFMAPSVQGQQAGLRLAYKDAGLDPLQVQYVEAHGTGTQAGDPVEINALGSVLCAGRSPVRPLLVGSVKTNIGHTEGAAGLAGLIKVVLCLKHKMIPPNLHFQEPSPKIPWDDYALKVPMELTPWPESEGSRLAGVSSFGIAGTNVHVIVEEAPVREPVIPTADAEPTSYLLPLSAQNTQALQDLATKYLQHLEDEVYADQALRDICYTASEHRSHFEQRLTIVGHSRQDMRQKLEAFTRGETGLEIMSGCKRNDQRPRVAWIFPGQGSQWLGMGHDLLEREPVFRAMIEECDRVMRTYVDWSLLEQLQADEVYSRLNEINVVQPTLFAIEVALAALWRSWGIEPDVVVGHSMGEVGAAYVAGALSLEDAAWIICARSQLLLRVSGKGAMAAVELSMGQAQAFVRDYQGRVSVAVSNSPHSTVLSGGPQALTEILALLERNGIFGRLVRVDVASHSPQMDPLHDDLLALMQRVQPRTAQIPMFSTVSGAYLQGAELVAPYWVDNLRQPVLFLQATRALLAEGIDVFMEISPHPILVGAIRQTLEEYEIPGLALASLRREEEGRAALLGTLGTLYTHGYDPDWARLFPTSVQHVALPTYPWQRQRYWNSNAEHYFYGSPVQHQGTRNATAHAILGLSTQSALHPDTYFWTTQIGPDILPYLGEHRVYDVPVLPGAAYIELSLAAATEIFGSQQFLVEELELKQALFFPKGAPPFTLQLIMMPEQQSEYMELRFFSTQAGQSSEALTWSEHARVTVCRIEEALSSESVMHPIPEEVQRDWTLAMEAPIYYQGLRNRGIQHGEPFQGVTHVWRRPGEVMAHLSLPEDVAYDMAGYQLHPALMDSILQAITPFLPEENDDSYVPVEARRIKFHQRPVPGVGLWSHALVDMEKNRDPRMLEGDIFLLDEQGQVLLEVLGFRLQSLDSGSQDLMRQRLNQLLYTIEWEEQALNAVQQPAQPRTWLLFSESEGPGRALAECLRASGGRCLTVTPGYSYSSIDTGHYELVATSAADFHQLFHEVYDAYGTQALGIVYLWGLGTKPASEELASQAFYIDMEQSSLGLLHLVQAVNATKGEHSTRLWIITSGVQGIEARDSSSALVQSQLWGLGRVIVYEHEDLHSTLIDLDATANEHTVEALFREIWSDVGADEVALRGERRYQARLAHATLVEPETTNQSRFHADGTYLVTGGLSGVGLRSAQWMVEQGARHLVLMGRRTPGEEASAAIQVMESQGASVRAMQVNVALEEQLASALSEIRQTMPPLRGVFHSAVVLDDSILLQLDQERFLGVMPPKVDGAWNLHRLTLEDPLDYFVLFSSAASLIGSPGQGNYAAANAFMDTLAFYRRRQGYPALCINWGRWGEIGQATKGDRGERLDFRGFASMKPKEGLAVLGSLLRQSPPQVGVMSFDLPRWSQFYPDLRNSSLFTRLVTEAQAQEASGIQNSGVTRAVLTDLNDEGRREKLSQYLSAQIARVLGHTSLKLDAQQQLNRLGIDSLMSVELKNRINSDLKITVPVTTFLQGVTFEQLITQVSEQL